MSKSTRVRFCIGIACLVAMLSVIPVQADSTVSPCETSLQYLEEQYQSDWSTKIAYHLVYRGLQDLPAGYSYDGSDENPWKAAGSGRGLHKMMVELFDIWCTALPEINGDSDNALDPILYFSWFYYQNPAGQDFVQGRNPLLKDSFLETGPTFLAMWGDEHRDYMDSAASAALVQQWVEDPRIEIEDYEKTEAAEYTSWNDFFARNLKLGEANDYPGRPVTMPTRDYVIVAPTDCIMNPLIQQVEKAPDGYERAYIENPLQLDTVLDIKNIPISVDDLLGTVTEEIKSNFVGGSGLSCVLMPNTYHHFHAPVDGTVIHAEIIEAGTPGTPGTFGYPDFPNWVTIDGNVGRPGTDFSQFQAFQRGVIIIKVEYANLPGETPETLVGYVASIPVGLGSVGSVVLNTCDSQATDRVNCFDVGGPVQKGVTKFGNFFYGGSLNILLFSEGMIASAVQTRMGNQIGVINAGTAPPSPWSLD